MSSPRIMVTGGAGFIGSHYTRALLQDPDARVTVLDALTYAGHRDNLPPLRGRRRIGVLSSDGTVLIVITVGAVLLCRRGSEGIQR